MSQEGQLKTCKGGLRGKSSLWRGLVTSSRQPGRLEDTDWSSLTGAGWGGHTAQPSKTPPGRMSVKAWYEKQGIFLTNHKILSLFARSAYYTALIGGQTGKKEKEWRKQCFLVLTESVSSLKTA